MKLFLELRDDEDHVHGDLEWTFGVETTVDELKDKVVSIFNVDPDYQQLYFNGSRLRTDTLQEAGIQHRSTVVLKHALLPMFGSFKKLLGSNVKTSEAKRDIARKLRVQKETFDSANFFIVYHTLYADLHEAYAEFICCLNYDPTVIMDSVKRYFGSLNVKRLLDKKPGGSNAGLIFTYDHDSTTETFYLKANETNWGANPDARELIVYLLLQHLGVGPSKSYFIPNAAHSKSVVYIATLKVPGFIMAKDLPNPMNEAAAVELHLLSILLNLTDLNTENFGLNGSGSLCIVDFSLTKIYKDSSCSDRFKEHVRRQPILSNLDNCPAWKRLQIAQEAMNRWDFHKAIDQAEKDFSHIREGMKEEVIFLHCATGAIKEYLDSVRWNVQKLSDEWSVENS